MIGINPCPNIAGHRRRCTDQLGVECIKYVDLTSGFTLRAKFARNICPSGISLSRCNSFITLMAVQIMHALNGPTVDSDGAGLLSVIGTGLGAGAAR
jgi:hypothetical protein